MGECSDATRRRALLIYINCSLAHYNQHVIPTPLNIDFSKLYTHLESCSDACCEYQECRFIKPFIFHLNNCIDELCSFCSVVQNFERKRLVTALKNTIIKNSNLEQDVASTRLDEGTVYRRRNTT